jgi:hypothetical protein
VRYLVLSISTNFNDLSHLFADLTSLTKHSLKALDEFVDISFIRGATSLNGAFIQGYSIA